MKNNIFACPIWVRFSLLFALLGFFSSAIAQETTTPTQDPSVQEFAKTAPEFPGGQVAMLQYLADNIQYPETARRAGIEGPVFVHFIVNEDGSISGATILRGISSDCDQEALRVVNAMPKWTPGKNEGVAVKVKHTLQVRFKLQKDAPKPAQNGQNSAQVMLPDAETISILANSDMSGHYVWTRIVAVNKYLQQQFRYPESARNANVRGNIVLDFEINPSGEVQNVKFQYGQGIDSGCKAEALRVLNAMPKLFPTPSETARFTGITLKCQE